METVDTRQMDRWCEWTALMHYHNAMPMCVRDRVCGRRHGSPLDVETVPRGV